MKTFLNEAGSCISILLRFVLMIGGMYVIFETGYERILEDPLYALVAIIFYYLVFTYNPTSEDET